MTNTANKIEKNTAKRTERAVRYILEEGVHVLARPYGMRHYAFNLEISNVSRSGFLLINKTTKFIPFSIGNRIHATIDIRSKVFERPLHFVFEIARIDECDGKTCYGVKIIEIVGEHQQLFEEAMDAMGSK